ncbi:hypothetical protein CBM2592_B130031 [Cupriavidus taiwanensis]|nr:hypothetical protein CBM2592_B130031 [Cupriavidus taiwanensis]SOY66205.1 hypothetical protein CBM2588_B170032 [Cupriavidus taiwanensis]SOY94271.1 hypothetical protein CBM2591_B120032 [Cupriavidus taiwanensis]SOZ86137.1 hypothetical protein CBM2618_B170032 [Cupriavidus taiwanensis]SOZ89466.1 hypothetical protein CBM2622_B170032 [Cupriavidus taiwanensis]
MAAARGGQNQMRSSRRAVAAGISTLPACQRKRCRPILKRRKVPSPLAGGDASLLRNAGAATVAEGEAGEGEETACVTTCTSNGFWIARRHRIRAGRRRLALL